MSTHINELQAALLARHGLSAADVARMTELSFSPSSVHIDRALTNLAVLIRNRDFIADSVMPPVDVPKPSDKYFVYDPDTMFEEQSAILTGQEAMPGRVRYKISTGNFSTVDYGLMDFVGYKEMAAADAPIVPQQHAVRVVTNRLDIAKERRVAGIVFASGNYGANTAALAGAARWDQPASDPAQAIDDAIEACDVRPNVIVIGAQVWAKMKNHPKLKELILSRQATAAGPTGVRVTPQLLAQAFELDAVLIGRAKYNTNREGQTSARGYIWGKSVALIHVTDAPSPENTETFGYQFRFQTRQTTLIENLLPGLSGGQYVKVTEALDEKVIGGAYSGYLYTTAVS